VAYNYGKIDMCKFQSSQKYESWNKQADSLHKLAARLDIRYGAALTENFRPCISISFVFAADKFVAKDWRTGRPSPTTLTLNGFRRNAKHVCNSCKWSNLPWNSRSKRAISFCILPLCGLELPLRERHSSPVAGTDKRAIQSAKVFFAVSVFPRCADCALNDATLSFLGNPLNVQIKAGLEENPFRQYFSHYA